jgi:very-short-patch-repair endonuclease
VDLRGIDRWATNHHGLVTKRVALAAGWSESAWYRSIDRGLIEPLHPGVARMLGSARTSEQRILAAVLAAGPRAIASHRSAARLWGVDRPDGDPVDLIVPRSSTRVELTGVVVHRPTDRDDMARSTRASIPTTNLLRTLIDLGAVAGHVDDAVSAAITSGVVTPMVLEYLLARHARRGRSGSGALRRALRAWPLQGKPADSELELRMARLLERYRLPPATFHPPRISGYEVDFLIDDTCVVLECDGWDHHGRTRSQFERDRERDLVLGRAGFVVFHFTWRQITRRPGWTADHIRALVSRWAPDLLGGRSTRHPTGIAAENLGRVGR